MVSRKTWTINSIMAFSGRTIKILRLSFKVCVVPEKNENPVSTDSSRAVNTEYQPRSCFPNSGPNLNFNRSETWPFLKFHGEPKVPLPKATPPQEIGKSMVNSPLIRPYLLGGGSFGGGTWDSHESCFPRSPGSRPSELQLGALLGVGVSSNRKHQHQDLLVVFLRDPKIKNLCFLGWASLPLITKDTNTPSKNYFGICLDTTDTQCR